MDADKDETSEQPSQSSPGMGDDPEPAEGARGARPPQEPAPEPTPEPWVAVAVESGETAAPELAGPDAPPPADAAASEPVVALTSSEGEEEKAAPTTPTRPERPAFWLPPRVEKPLLARSRKSHVAPALISLDRIDEDGTFRMRPEGEVTLLATDIARLGQLFPVDVRLRRPDRFQIVCGFRRVAALRFLQRDRVLARLHTDLTDEDALLMALADAIHAEPVTPEQLLGIQARLEQEGRLGAEARDMLEKALAPDDNLAPENVEEEVDAEELASDVTERLGDLNQDLALLADVFASLEPEQKQTLLEQLRYASELVTYLEGL